MSMGALGRFKVAEFAFNVAGPYCGMMMADLGADVVKVERPGRGDSARAWGTWSDGNRSVLFLGVNRNKRSLAVDLQTPEGVEAARRLIAASDVVIESMSPGVMDRLGLGFETARELSSEVVYVSISGYGQNGPLAAEGGFDSMVQALTGLMDMTGFEGMPPARIPVSSLDYLTGAIAFGAATSTLLKNEQLRADGEPVPARRVDASLYDSAINMVGPYLTDAAVDGRVQGRSGGELHYVAPYGTYAAADGYFCLGVGSDNLWRKFCAGFDLQHLVDDARYAQNEARVAHRNELRASLEALFGRMTIDEIMSLARRAGVPATPVLSVDQNLKSEHLRTRQGLDYIDLVGPGGGQAPIAATPLRASPPIVRDGPVVAPPLLGADSAEVLAELGYSAEEIDSFLDAEVGVQE